MLWVVVAVIISIIAVVILVVTTVIIVAVWCGSGVRCDGSWLALSALSLSSLLPSFLERSGVFRCG